jgi:membrane-associated phospholipid phosphatase
MLVSTSFVVATCLTGQTALAQTTPAPAAVSDASAPQPAGLTLQDFPVYESTVVAAPKSSNFFKSTLTDFKNLASKETVAWLAVGAMAASVTHPADVTVTRHVSGPAMMEQVRPGNVIGGKEFQFGASIAALAIGKFSGNDRVSDVAGKVLRAQIMSQALTVAIKKTAQRTRPDGSDTRSFPSGHTSISFASASVLQRELGWKVGIPAYAVAGLVATARIEKKKHYLSDVVMGASIGILAGRTVTVGSGKGRFAVSPVPTAGGAAVNFSWVGSN